jgi:lysozyme family protein
MAQFDQIIGRILAHEGGFVEHPKDPGGATNFGITERVARAAGYRGHMRNLPRETAVAIYRAQYWDRVQGDKLPGAVAFQVVDAAVNHGTGNAIRWLQAAAGVAADGIIGPVTLAAVRKADPADLVLVFNAIRLEFYAALSTFGTFGRGWTRRVAGNLRLAAHDNGSPG